MARKVTKGSSRKAWATGPAQALVEWYNQRRSLYSKTTALTLELWSSVLSFRREILRGEVPDNFSNARDAYLAANFSAISEDPLARRRVYLGKGRPFVHELSPVELVDIAKLYSVPPFPEMIEDWRRQQAGAGPGGARLAQLFCGAPRHEDFPTLHLLTLCPETIGLTSEEIASRSDLKRHQVSAQIGIDLSASDDILIDGFKTWLRNQRQLMTAASVKWGRPPPRGQKDSITFSEKVLDRWCRLRVLDYIDIGIAAGFLGVKVPTKQQYSVMLFPNEQVENTRIRHVEGLASWLLERETITAIGNRAIADFLDNPGPA